ncbi:MAG: FliM/FliN family flagellar motor switch protein [Myxococcota bacterium]|nr:FliM/FliN family flagellar motor switch protein [Myxococcota bacterium]
MSSAPLVRSFPWASLDATTRAEETARRDARRWASRHINVHAIRSALSEMLDCRVTIYFRRARLFIGGSGLADALCVALAPQDAQHAEARVVLEVEHALAANVVARAVRRTPTAVVRGSVALAPPLAGAFAAVVMAIARRAHGDDPMRLVDAEAGPRLGEELANLATERIAILVTVLLEEDAFSARLLVPRGMTAERGGHAWTRERLAALADTPLAVPLVACTLRMTAAEIAQLRPGDALVPGRWAVALSTTGEVVAGTLWLAAPSSGLGHRTELVENGRLVLGGRLESLEPAEADLDANERAALVESVGEVPIAVRVEIGEAVMPARDWAALERGDVITLGRRVGATVLLRVAGLAVARGELVSIDGEIGVRITERTIPHETSP